MDIIGIVLISIAFVGLSLVFLLIYKTSSFQDNLTHKIRKDAFKEAAELAKERGDFELQDTEGKSGERFHRARIAFEIELELRSLAGKHE